MQVRALVSPSVIEQAAMHSTLGAIVLWSGVLVREWPRMAAGGPLCGEAQALFGHCALCWPAAALSVVALALLVPAYRIAERRA